MPLSSTGTGASAPAVAACHAASKNSRFVSARLTARLATRSGDTTSTAPPSGRSAVRGERPGTSCGSRLSIPSTAMPSLIFSSSEPSAGKRGSRAAARSRTSSVSSSSRAGQSSTVSSGSPALR